MIITLLTDFGYRDPFVGIMKGVIAGINPQARLIDLSHGIAPQDVMAAALVLRHSVAYFPRGTIHVAVVDPGVGSKRRPLLVSSEGNFFVGPDNGVLSLALDKQSHQAVHLTNTAYQLKTRSATFHGRDIFAPVAAHLSLGIAPTAFGHTVGNMVGLVWPAVKKSQQSFCGEIIYIDGFGNLVTNIKEEDLPAPPRERLNIICANVFIHGVVPHYAAGEAGQAIALINSWGLLEIAVYEDSAASRYRVKIGDRVEIVTQ